MTRALVLSAFLVVGAFQNCSPPDSSTENSAPGLSLSSGGGSGTGYDGKIFVVLRQGGICADGNLVESQIEFRLGQALLTRQDCKDLPLTNPPISVEFDAGDASVIYFDGTRFVEAKIFINHLMENSGSRLVLGALSQYQPEVKFTGFISHFAPDGRVTWTKRVSTPRFFGTPAKAGRCPDGTFLIGAGPLIRLNAAGDLVWQKAFAIEGGGAEVDVLDVHCANDGSITVLGHSTAAQTSYVFRLDSEGHVRWQYGIRQPALAPGSLFRNLSVTSSGEVYLGGIVSYEVILVKLTAQGALDWSKRLEGFNYSYSVRPDYVFRASPSGGLIFTGLNSRGAYLAELDTAANLVWSRLLVGTSLALYGLQESTSNEFVLTGTMENQAILLALSSDRQLQFALKSQSFEAFIGSPLWGGDDSGWSLGGSSLGGAHSIVRIGRGVCPACVPAIVTAESFSPAMGNFSITPPVAPIEARPTNEITLVPMLLKIPIE